MRNRGNAPAGTAVPGVLRAAWSTFFDIRTKQQERGREVMCIAMPAEVLEIKEGNIGVVDFGDLQQEVRLDLVDVKVGEFVLVHVGFAIQRLSREEGLETREVFRQVYAAMSEE